MARSMPAPLLAGRGRHFLSRATSRALFQNGAKRSVPVRSWRIVLEIADPPQMQVVKCGTGAAQVVAFADQFANDGPLAAEQRIEDMFMERVQRLEFGRRARR